MLVSPRIPHIVTHTRSVVFQWSISYMISPDAANLGIKAIYVWAGLLVPTTVLLYFFYPEVSPTVYVVIEGTS